MPETAIKAYRRYRKVAIFRLREQIAGSDTRANAQGDEVPCKPRFRTYYAYEGGYPEDTVEAVKQSIDLLIRQAVARGCDEADMVETLNGAGT